MAEPDVARFEALLTSRGRELLDRIATEAPGLGERALICSGASDFTQIPQAKHVKVVGAVNHTAVFPACRAIVHHGGTGTTATIRSGQLRSPAWESAPARSFRKPPRKH